MSLPKYLNPKNYFRKLIKICIVNPLIKLKFVNYKHHYIHGPKERLIIKNVKNVNLENTIFNTRCGIITVGDGVLFSHHCMVLTGKHNYQAKDIKKIWDITEENRSIEIGDGTWVASGAIICGDVKIGKHCVIAAGAVVTKDVPDGCMAAGVPAKVVQNI